MIDIVVPTWGLTMDEAIFVRWLKSVGDYVIKGEPLAEIETDKTVAEVESPASGHLVSCLAQEGESVQTAQLIGTLKAE